MKNLKISFYRRREEKPEKVVTIPLTMLHVASQIIPKKAKTALERDGINLMVCKDLVKEKGLNGTLIEIENPTETMVISVE